MKQDLKQEMRKMSQDNAISVIKKILVGSLVIAFVGICAFLCLVLLMALI